MSAEPLFKQKTLPDIFEDIFKTAKNKDKQLTTLIAKLTGYITDQDSAAQTIPLLKEYFELQIRNDDSVIKMARIAQLYLKDEKEGELMSDDYSELMKEADDILAYQEENEKKVTIDLKIENGDTTAKLLEEGDS